MKYKIIFKAEDGSGFANVPVEIRNWMRENEWQAYYAEELSDELHFMYIKYITLKDNSTRSYVKLGIKIPYHKEYKPVVYKLNQDGDYLKLTDTELKFFDALDYDLTLTQKLETEQDITDWFK